MIGGRAARIMFGNVSEKQSFSANRWAKPEELLQVLHLQTCNTCNSMKQGYCLTYLETELFEML